MTAPASKYTLITAEDCPAATARPGAPELGGCDNVVVFESVNMTISGSALYRRIEPNPTAQP